MRILGIGALHEFCAEHADSRDWIENWLADAKASSWRRPQDIRNRYASASFLAGNVVIFNVRGNNYRLEVKVAYNAQTVLIRWIGTHAEYSRRHG